MSDRGLLLLALDDSSTLELMSKSLRGAGYELAPVRDIEGLHKLLKESKPALVLIGQTFSEQSGIQLSGELLDRFPTLNDSWGSLQPWGLHQFASGDRIKPRQPDRDRRQVRRPGDGGRRRH